MNSSFLDILNAFIKVQEARGFIQQMDEIIDEDNRRKELRKGSIDVEFRVIK